MLVLLLLAACAGDDASDCAAWPDEAVAADGVLGNADTCGYWRLGVGEHLYVNVSVTVAESPCTASMEPAIGLNADPIYTNLSNDGPKWTFDVVGLSATDGYAGLQVECGEGTTFAARVVVE